MVPAADWNDFDSAVYNSNANGNWDSAAQIFLRHFGLSKAVRFLEAAGLDPDA